MRELQQAIDGGDDARRLCVEAYGPRIAAALLIVSALVCRECVAEGFALSLRQRAFEPIEVSRGREVAPQRARLFASGDQLCADRLGGLDEFLSTIAAKSEAVCAPSAQYPNAKAQERGGEIETHPDAVDKIISFLVGLTVGCFVYSLFRCWRRP